MSVSWKRLPPSKDPMIHLLNLDRMTIVRAIPKVNPNYIMVNLLLRCMTLGMRKRKPIRMVINPQWNAKLTMESMRGAERKVLRVIAISVIRKMKVCSLE